MSRETNYLMNTNSRKKPDETMASLYDDALTNIFSWLPAKQVAQLRCLSKTWNARLSEPVFLKSHLDHAVHLDDKETFLVFYRSFYSFNHQPFTVIKFPDSRLELMNFIKLPANIPSEDATCSVNIGSINGLICFRYRLHHQIRVINIWNPCISKLLVLPQSTNIPWATRHYHLFSTFGFDPKTDDYKVVTLRFRSGPPSAGLKELTVPKECWLVEVYSMRKGSWKLITDKFPSHVTRIYHEEEVCVHGHYDHIHWLGDHGEERTRQTIVAFDFGGETFTEIALPNSIQVSIQNRSISLGYMAGKICLMSHVSDDECEIWVMDRYEMTQSWVKHIVFSQFSGGINPSGFMDGEFIYKAYSNSLALYNPIATKDKPLKVMAIHVRNTKVVRYVESLVWVAPALDQHLLTEV